MAPPRPSAHRSSTSFLTATDWLADHTGNPAAAEAYIAAMIRAYLPERGAGRPATALKSLSTDGGLNATLR